MSHATKPVTQQEISQWHMENPEGDFDTARGYDRDRKFIIRLLAEREKHLRLLRGLYWSMDQAKRFNLVKWDPDALDEMREVKAIVDE